VERRGDGGGQQNFDLSPIPSSLLAAESIEQEGTYPLPEGALSIHVHGHGALPQP
jgi:hypothetical protein